MTNFWFWKYSPIFYSNSATIGALFRPFRAIFGVGVRFKNFFVTFLYRQSTLVLEVPYLLSLICPYLGPLLLFFGPFRAFYCLLGSRSGSKIFLEPTNLDYQLLFWKCSLNLAKFWALLHFLDPWRLFLGSGSGFKKILVPAYID